MSLQSVKENKYFDSFFILLLLCVFAFGALLIVIFSIKSYQNISEKTDNNFNQITPLSYVASKVRQFDALDAIRLESKDGTTALVIKNLDNNEMCETWIYNYDGCIYEIYLGEEASFTLSDGNAIFENSTIEFMLENDKLLHITCYNNNIQMSLTLALRTYVERGVNNE